MAGDWIKMRTDLARDPAVIAIADTLQRDRVWVVGALHAVWSWFDEQSRDGCADVALMFVDSLVSVTGLAEAMLKVGWLEERQGGGIRLPRFDKHNGKTGKSRALARNRMQRLRDGDSATGASPEKRREEKKKYPLKPPNGGQTVHSNGRSRRQRPLTEQEAVAAALRGLERDAK